VTRCHTTDKDAELSRRESWRLFYWAWLISLGFELSLHDELGELQFETCGKLTSTRIS
jgi:hypothetical protein